MSLNNLLQNEKIEDLPALKKKEDEKKKIQSSGYWLSSALLQQLQVLRLQYIVSFAPDYLEDFEEDFDDDFDDYFRGRRRVKSHESSSSSE